MNSRDRRAIVIGATAILGAVFAFRVAPSAIRGVGRLHSRVEQEAQLASTARSVLATASLVRDSLGPVLNDIVALAPRLVDGHTAAEAQSSLSALVSLAATRHALKVVRLDPGVDSAVGVFIRVTVHGEMEGDVAGIAALLKAIETGERLLSVTALAVSAPDIHTNRNGPEVLHIEADVAGYYLPRGER